MLDKDQIAAASRVLVQHWRDGSKLEALEPRLRPRSRTEGYAIQAVLETQSLGHLFGWKIAATSVSGQKHINVTGPLAGRIMSDTVIADGGTASMKGNEMRVGEPEFAFRMGRDLPPRSASYTVDEVLAAVDSFHPAIEIPDSRFADFVSAGEAQLIADNACAHLFVLGRQRLRTGARWISSRSGRRSRCAASAMSATARTCSAIPAPRSPGLPMSSPGSASPCGQGRW